MRLFSYFTSGAILDIIQTPSSSTNDSASSQSRLSQSNLQSIEDMASKATDAVEFVAKINGTSNVGDSLITIEVGMDKKKKTYWISENQLTSASGYFKAALSNNWVEGQTKTIVLAEDLPLAFDLIIQWIYCRHAVMPENLEIGKLLSKSGSLSVWLLFLKLADYLDIVGPCETTVEPIEKLLVADNKVLRPFHIRMAGDLPRGNPILPLFAKTCVESYMMSKHNWHSPYDSYSPKKNKAKYQPHASEFEKELEEVDGFGMAILRCIPINGLITKVIDGARRGRGRESENEWIETEMSKILAP